MCVEEVAARPPPSSLTKAREINGTQKFIRAPVAPKKKMSATSLITRRSFNINIIYSTTLRENIYICESDCTMNGFFRAHRARFFGFWGALPQLAYIY